MGLSSSILFACNNVTNNENDENKQAHFLSSDFDTTVTLGNDFYQYTNGGWMNAHPIPGEKNRLNTFEVLNDENLVRLK